MLAKTTKKKVITTHSQHEKDTGSAEVQIALFTEKINELTLHLKEHKKDNHSRRRLLEYLQKKSPELYAAVVKKLKLIR